jgi:pimeloyl-ACP methyl ester carboxylesterase
MRNPRLTADTAEFVAQAWSRPESDSPEVRLRFDPRHRLVNPILYRREEAEACWARLEIPMLLVMGELSDHRARHTSYVTDEQLHALFRKVQLVTVPGTGHMMHHEDPGSVARHVVAFERDCVSSVP